MRLVNDKTADFNTSIARERPEHVYAYPADNSATNFLRDKNRVLRRLQDSFKPARNFLSRGFVTKLTGKTSQRFAIIQLRDANLDLLLRVVLQSSCS